MFNVLSHSIAIVSGLILTMIAVIFITVIMVIQQQEPYQTSTPQIIDTIPKVELTDQQKLGKSLFKANCASCHKLNKKMIGPGLRGVTERYDREWLYLWIKDSQALIKSGDAQAVTLYNEYNQTNMNAFPQLSNEDIDAILSYIN